MKFEAEWTRTKAGGIYAYFTFNGVAADWNQAVHAHFKPKKHSGPHYGVYVFRQKSTAEVIYIGKSGTMQQDGTLKPQDFEKRLVNNEDGKPRNSRMGARVSQYGDLLIEYVILNPQKLAPGYVEARLLQAFFDEHRHLPPDNSEL
jgi:hypothetical protein